MGSAIECPNCENVPFIEDWNDTEPFECEHCEEMLRLVIDESTYNGAVVYRLELADDWEELNCVLAPKP